MLQEVQKQLETCKTLLRKVFCLFMHFFSSIVVYITNDLVIGCRKYSVATSHMMLSVISWHVYRSTGVGFLLAHLCNKSKQI